MSDIYGHYKFIEEQKQPQWFLFKGYTYHLHPQYVPVPPPLDLVLAIRYEMLCLWENWAAFEKKCEQNYEQFPQWGPMWGLLKQCSFEGSGLQPLHASALSWTKQYDLGKRDWKKSW